MCSLFLKERQDAWHLQFASSIKYMKSTKNSTRLFFVIAGVVPLAIILFSVSRTVSINEGEAKTAPVDFWSVTFLADRNTLATTGGLSNPNDTPRRGELVLWNLTTNRETLVLREGSSVRSVSASPDGKLLAIGEFSGATKLITPATGTIVSSLISPGAVNAVSLSSDNKFVASGGLDGTVMLWNVETKQSDRLDLPDETVINVAISPDDRELVATTRRGKAYLFDLLHRGKPLVLPAYDIATNSEANVEAVAFAPDSKSFVTGSQKCLRLWNASTGTFIRELDGSTANINCATFSPDGKLLATVDSDGTLALWDPANGERRLATKAHSGTSFGVAFSPDGGRIATIGRDENTAKIWDAHSLAPLTTLQRNYQPIQR